MTRGLGFWIVPTTDGTRFSVSVRVLYFGMKIDVETGTRLHKFFPKPVSLKPYSNNPYLSSHITGRFSISSMNKSVLKNSVPIFKQHSHGLVSTSTRRKRVLIWTALRQTYDRKRALMRVDKSPETLAQRRMRVYIKRASACENLAFSEPNSCSWKRASAKRAAIASHGNNLYISSSNV